jgi:processive 1,2-diacylglycerol beta-glucosyltransferase
MVELRDKSTGRSVGQITEAQLGFLMTQLEEESPQDTDYYFNSATIEMLAERGADPQLLEVLRKALGPRQEAEIEWTPR